MKFIKKISAVMVFGLLGCESAPVKLNVENKTPVESAAEGVQFQLECSERPSALSAMDTRRFMRVHVQITNLSEQTLRFDSGHILSTDDKFLYYREKEHTYSLNNKSVEPGPEKVILKPKGTYQGLYIYSGAKAKDAPNMGPVNFKVQNIKRESADIPAQEFGCS